MARAESDPAAPDNAPLDFDAQYRAHMAKLGKKGGKISGAKLIESESKKAA